MMKYIITLIVTAFLLGMAVQGLYGAVAEAYPTLASGASTGSISLSSLTNPKEVSSPFARISQDKIHVLKDRVVIEMNNPQWATFTDTNSMDPVFDAGHYALQVVPETENDIHIGDIISYEFPGISQGNLIHRVIQVGSDSNGWYAITKGDNNTLPDPGRVRFKQIKRVVAAIVY